MSIYDEFKSKSGNFAPPAVAPPAEPGLLDKVKGFLGFGPKPTPAPVAAPTGSLYDQFKTKTGTFAVETPAPSGQPAQPVATVPQPKTPPAPNYLKDEIGQELLAKYPGTIQTLASLQEDPFGFNTLSKGKFWNRLYDSTVGTIEQAFKDQVQRGRDLSEEASKSGNFSLGTAAKALSFVNGAFNLVFSPISAAIGGAEQLPGTKPLAQTLLFPVNVASEALSNLMKQGVEATNFSPEVKQKITGPLSETAGLVGMFAVGEAMSRVKLPKGVLEAATKNITTKYNLPTSVFIDATKARDIINGVDTASEKARLLKSLGTDAETLKNAARNGISIQVPVEKVVTLTDRPYWAKLKQTMRISPSEAEIRSTTAGQPKVGPRGLLGPGKGIYEDFKAKTGVFAEEKPPITPIKEQPVKTQTGIEPPTITAPETPVRPMAADISSIDKFVPEKLIQPEEALNKTPMDLAERWDNAYAGFADNVEAPAKKKITLFKAELDKIKGQRGPEAKSFRSRIENEIDSLNEKISQAKDVIDEENMQFQLKLVDKAAEMAQKSGLDLGKYVPTNGDMEKMADWSPEWASFRDDLITKLYDRPHIETNWNDPITKIIDETIKDYGGNPENRPNEPIIHNVAFYKTEEKARAAFDKLKDKENLGIIYFAAGEKIPTDNKQGFEISKENWAIANKKDIPPGENILEKIYSPNSKPEISASSRSNSSSLLGEGALTISSTGLSDSVITNYITALREKSQNDKANFERTLLDSTGKTPEVRIKSDESTKEKIARIVAEGKPDIVISDHLGGKIAVDSKDIAKQIENINSKFNVARTFNFFDKPGRWGYRGVNIIAKLPGGTLAEIQIHTPESVKAAEAIRPIFEKWRNKLNLTEDEKLQKEKDRAESNRLADNAMTESPKMAFGELAAQEKEAELKTKTKPTEDFKKGLEDLGYSPEEAKAIEEMTNVPTKTKITPAEVTERKNLISSSEEIIRNIYRKAPEVQAKLDRIFMELDIAEAGYRYTIPGDIGMDREWRGMPSTFPKWIPDHLRSKKLFNKVLPSLQNVDKITFPAGRSAKIRQFYNEILKKLDSELKVDTEEPRNVIIEAYDEITGKTQIEKTFHSGVTGSERPRGTAEGIPSSSSELRDALAAEEAKFDLEGPDRQQAVDRANELRDAFNKFADENKKRAFYLPNPNKAHIFTPAVDIETLKFDDGKFSYSLSINTLQAGRGGPFGITELYPTAEEAARTAAQEVLKWATDMVRTEKGRNATEVKQAQRIIKAVEEKYPGLEKPTQEIPITAVKEERYALTDKAVNELFGEDMTKILEETPAPEEMQKRANTPSGGYASIAGDKKSINAMVERLTAEEIQEPPKGFKISERAKQVLRDLQIPVSEKDLSSRFAGLFKHLSKNVRVQSGYDITTLVHEATHALDERHGIHKKLMEITGYAENGNPIYAKETAPIRKALTDIYEEYYPTGKRTHKLDKRLTEGLGAFIENYFYNPAEMTDKFGPLVDAFIKPDGKFYHPDFTKLLEGMNSVVEDYAKLPPEERIAARIRRGNEVVDERSGFTMAQRAIFEIYNRFEPLVRARKTAGVKENTWDDPNVQAFNIMNKNSIIFNWVKGDVMPVLKSDGNWDIREGSVRKYLELIKGKEKEFDSYLIARRVIEDHNRLSALKETVQKIAADAANYKAEHEGATSKDYFMESGIDPAEVQRLMEDYKNLKKTIANDDFKLQDATAVVNKFAGEFANAEKMFDDINKNLLDFSVGTQLLKADIAEKWKSEEGYASFRRYVEDDLDARVGTVGGSVKSKVSSFKERHGSNLDIVSPTYNQIAAITEVIGKGLENLLWERVDRLADKNVEISRRFERIEPMPAVDKNGRISFPQEKDPNIIRYFKNGKREFRKAGEEFLMVAKSLRPKELDVFARILRIPSSVFTRLTTSANPFFALGNFSVDQFSMLMQTKTKSRPLIDPAHGLYEFIKGTPEFKEYVSLGGRRQTLAAYFDLSPEELQHKLTGGSTKLERTTDIIDGAIGVLEIPSNMSEIVTRFSEYKRARAQGKNPSEAMYMASQVTIPFQLSGNFGGRVGQEFVRSIPYFNAALQVIYKYVRTAKEQPTKVATATAGVVASAYTLAILTMLAASDEQKRQLGEQPVRLLSRYLFIPSPDGHTLIRLRIPEQIGSISGMVYLYVISNFKGNEAKFADYAGAATAWVPPQMNPFQLQQLVFGYVPQIGKPSLEVAAGVKTYPQILPIIPESLKDKPPSEQYTEYTSRLGKFIGQLTNTPPIVVDFWIKEQFGAVGGLFVEKIPSNPIYNQQNQYILAGRSINDFYNEKAVIDQQHQKLTADPKSIALADRPGLMLSWRNYDRMATTISDFRAVLKSGHELPEATKQLLYEALVNLNKADGKNPALIAKIAGLGAKANALKAQYKIR